MQTKIKNGFIFIHNPTLNSFMYVFHPSFTSKLVYQAVINIKSPNKKSVKCNGWLILLTIPLGPNFFFCTGVLFAGFAFPAIDH